VDYAIIEMGGKQYRVQKGDSVVVDRVDAKEGAKVSARPVMAKSGSKTVLEGPDLDKVKVEAVVAEHLKGEKIRVFKYRPKKRYRRRGGHRSLLTRLEISDIRMPGGRAKAGDEGAPKARAKPKADAAETAAEKPRAAASRPRAKPAAAKKKDDGATKKQGERKQPTRSAARKPSTGKTETDS
jgi:large subunit ribosomal protein L21